MMVRRSRLWAAVPLYLMALAAPGPARAQFLDENRPATSAQITLPQRRAGDLLNEHPVHVIVAWDGGTPALSEAALEAVSEAHGVMERQPGVDQVLSIDRLRRWLKDRGVDGPQSLERYVEILPEGLARRLLAPERNAALVTVRSKDARPLESKSLVQNIDRALEGVRIANPGLDISVAGPFDTPVAALERFERDDAAVIVRGKDLLKRRQLEAFRGLVVELSLVEGVTGLVSVLSARGIPDEAGYAAPVVLDDLPESGADYDAVVESLKSSYLAQGLFLSGDGQSAMIGLSLAESPAESVMPDDIERMIGESIRNTFEPALAGTGLEAELHVFGRGPCKGGHLIRGRGLKVGC